MEHIEFLKEVAQELGQQNILNSLNAIQERASQQNANLLIPLVGEFSSGKTTLLNALTDSKKLETATKPTTATIYEIHFGCNKCEANVVLSDGQVAHFDDLGELKNDQLRCTNCDCIRYINESSIINHFGGYSGIVFSCC